MRVLHAVRQYKPSVGGFEDVIANLCRELEARHGISSTVVTLDRVFGSPGARLPAEELVDGIPVRRIPYFGSRRYPIAPRILAELGEADLIHVHAVDFFFDALAWSSKLHRRPLVASTHGGFFHTDFAAGAKQLYFSSVTRLSSRAYGAICASSENDYRLFSRIAPKNTVLVENGVDVMKWRNAASAEPRPTLIFIGRFASNKRIDRLFPILRSLRALDPAWRLIVAGREFDLQVAELETLAEELGVRSSVKLVNSPTDEECRLLIGASSYFISASAHEGFGLSAVEGLSAGLTPILSDIPPFRALVARSGTGLIIDVQDPDRTARDINALHCRGKDETSAARESAIGAADRYTWPAVAARFAEIYADTLEARRLPRRVTAGIGAE